MLRNASPSYDLIGKMKLSKTDSTIVALLNLDGNLILAKSRCTVPESLKFIFRLEESFATTASWILQSNASYCALL